jgi:ParB family chromosome partitioning protein
MATAEGLTIGVSITTDEFQLVPIDELHESPLNPRRQFDAHALEELAASIRKSGVHVPLLVRPRPEGGYEIGAGARRNRASRLAGVTEVPVRIRPMEDAAFLELLTVENLQREDVTPIEEATGFKLLLDRAGYDVPAIAEKIGKSREYVYGRLKLLELAAPVQKALDQGDLTPSHAVLLARLEPEVQAAVTKDVLDSQRHGDAVSVRDLNGTIEHQVRQAKRERAIAEALANAAEEHPGQKIYRLGRGYSGDKGVLGYGEWKECGKRAAGAMPGLLTDAYGHDKPKLVYFTRPPKERQLTAEERDKQWREREKKQREKEAKQTAGELAVRLAFANATKSLDRQLMAMIVDALLDQGFMGQAVERKFLELVGAGIPSKRFGILDAARPKLPGLSLEKLAQAAVFLLVDPDEQHGLATRARLAQLAKRYKLDPTKIAAEAEAAIAPQTSATKRPKKGA